MKVEDILKLKNAGFSDEDIVRFSQAVDLLPDAPQAEQPVLPEAPKPETTTKAEPAPAWVEQFQKDINALTRTIQATNLRNVSNPEPKEKDPVEILSEVIAPPLKTKGQ